MAVVAVNLSGVTRVNDAEALGTVWSGVLEIEAIYQNTNSVSVKVKTSEAGPHYYNSATSHAFSTNDRTWIAKLVVTTFNNLNATASTSMIAEIGTGSRSAYYRYYLFTDTTYPPDRSWLFIPINPNIAGYRSATVGTPTLSAIDYYGHKATMKTTAAKAENVAMDAIDFVDAGGGLILTGGDSTDPDGTMADFLSFDEGTKNNRYGLITSREGILYVLSTMIIGSATATVFTDSNRVVVFPDGRFSAGFCGMKFDLANATNNIAITSFVFNGRGTKAGGSTDTRPDYTVTGTSGVLSIISTVFNRFRNFTLTSKATLTECSFLGGELVTQAGGTIDGGEFSGCTGTHYILATNPSLILNSNFTQGTGGHAVRCDTQGTYDWVGNTDTGYTGTRGSNLVSSTGSADAMFYNNSSGLITLNVSDGQSPSVRNGASATTQVNNNVTLLVQGVTEGAACYIERVSDQSVLLQALADSTGKASANFNYVSDTPVIVRVRASGLPSAAILDDGGAFTDQTTAANSATIDDMTLLPTVPVTGDAYYFGHNEQFGQLKLWITTAGVGGGTITWKYWNGAWTTLSGVSDGTSNFSLTGEKIVSWTIPGDWADTTINSQGPYRYIKAEFTAGSFSTAPKSRQVKLDVTRYLPFSQNLTIISTGLTATATWIQDKVAIF